MSDEQKYDNKRIVVGPFETVEVKGDDGKWSKFEALVDTGARVSSIDETEAVRLGLYSQDKVLYEGSYSSALGEQKRPVIAMTFKMAGKVIHTKVNVADRSDRKRKMLVGRRDLTDHLVKVEKGDDVK